MMYVGLYINIRLDELDWSVCTCLTQLYDGRYMYRIYYIKNNYMFRHFTLVIFRLRNKKLMWVVYSGEVRGEVGTRSLMCYVGWVVWVQGGSAISVRQVHKLQSSSFINTTGMTNLMICLDFYDPKRSRHVNTLTLLIFHKLVY